MGQVTSTASSWRPLTPSLTAVSRAHTHARARARTHIHTHTLSIIPWTVLLLWEDGDGTDRVKKQKRIRPVLEDDAP